MPPPPESFEIKMPATVVSQHAWECTVQIRVHIFLLKPAVHRIRVASNSAHISCAVPCYFFSFLFFLAFTLLNCSPSLISPLLFSVFQSSSKQEVLSTQRRGRHLLDFASEEETEAAMGPGPLTNGPSEVVDR